VKKPKAPIASSSRLKKATVVSSPKATPSVSLEEGTKKKNSFIPPSCYFIKISNEETLSRFWEEYQGFAHGDFSASPHFSMGDQIKPKNCPLKENDFLIINYDKNIKPYMLLRYCDEGKYRFVKEQRFEKLKPLNVEQVVAFELLTDPSVHFVTLIGSSGTGKTIIAIESALEQIMGPNKKYKRLVIIRPIHPVGKDIGYLPGDMREKLDVWMSPIKDNLKFLLEDNEEMAASVDSFGGNKVLKPGFETARYNGQKRNRKGNRRYHDEKRQASGAATQHHQPGTTLDYFLNKGIIEVEALTYIRGRSINNSIILLDESQNISAHELKAVLTRAGQNTKVIFTGDIEQIDRLDLSIKFNALTTAIQKFHGYALFGHVSLHEGLRSELSALAARIL
jgi:PhoH-like ATPase